MRIARMATEIIFTTKDPAESSAHGLDDAHLNGVHDLVAGADGADDDDGVAFAQHAFSQKDVEGRADVFIEVVGIEGHDEGSDAPVESEFLSDGLALAEGVDGRVTGAQPGKVTGHAAAANEDDEGVGAEFVGHDDGALGDFFARVGQLGVFPIIRAAAAFDAGGDAVKHLDALERVFADGGFAAEHDGVRLLENGVGDVSDFGAGGHGRLNHAFEHVGGDDDGAADMQAGLDNEYRWMMGSSS